MNQKGFEVTTPEERAERELTSRSGGALPRRAAEASGRPGWSRRLGWLPVVYLLFVLFPGVHEVARTGIDGSWVVGINELFGSSYHFGRDVVFTWGPLAFFFAPLSVRHNYAEAQVFWLVIYVLLAWCILRLRRRIESDRTFWIFAALLATAMAVSVGQVGEYRLLTLFTLLLVLSAGESRPFWPPVALGILAATFLFMKTSVGLAALLVALGSLVVEFLQDRRRALIRLMWMSSGFAAALAIWGALLLGSLPAFVLWLRASKEIAGDYSVAESVVGASEILILGLLALAVLERLIEQSFIQRARVTVPVSVGALIAFKHGFTRQDQHVLVFFAFALALQAILYAFTDDGRLRRRTVAGFAVTLALTFSVLGIWDRPTIRDSAKFVVGRTGWENLVALVRLPAEEKALAAKSAAALKSSRLDPQKLRRIKEEGGKVGVMPWELSLVPVNGLDWQPTWMLQTYSAHTAWLDQENAASVSGSRAPHWMLFNFEDTDGRNLLQSAPLASRAVLENYELAEGTDGAGWLLLRKRAAPRPIRLMPFGSDRIRDRSWCDVPARDSLVFAGLDMRLSLLGRAAQLFFRVPPVMLDCQLDDGRESTSRLIPATAANGIPIGCVIRSTEEFEGLLSGRRGPRVVRFSINGPGTIYYRWPIRVTWMEASGLPGTGNASSGPAAGQGG